ncbi:FAD-dependent monooxygenase [Streptomyces sp. NPDC001848]|uniref:FAD-dependent monooxygenase n=1 Tax=Streptomyces sp. NPDC001848 TaxID=3364618 RepID=UPI003685149C
MLDVLIAGAGPVGLWLVAGLRLHGVEAALEGRSRAVGMQAGMLDTFATRGLAERFIERGTPVPATDIPLHLGHRRFASTAGWVTEMPPSISWLGRRRVFQHHNIKMRDLAQEIGSGRTDPD